MQLVTSRELREELKQDIDHLESKVRCHRGDTYKRSQEHGGRMSSCNSISMSENRQGRDQSVYGVSMAL